MYMPIGAPQCPQLSICSDVSCRNNGLKIRLPGIWDCVQLLSARDVPHMQSKLRATDQELPVFRKPHFQALPSRSKPTTPEQFGDQRDQ